MTIKVVGRASRYDPPVLEAFLDRETWNTAPQAATPPPRAVAVEQTRGFLLTFYKSPA